MPNHVTNVFIVKGTPNRLSEFKERVKGVEPDDKFSFQSIIPMPECTRKTESGSRQHEGERVLRLLEGTETDMSFLLKDRQGHWEKNNVVDIPLYIAYIQEKSPQSIDLAKLSRQSIAETGYPTWYEWSIKNWGTKWNCYDVNLEESEDTLSYTFLTAWSLPDPIYNKLAGEFPGLFFQIKYFDEGHGFWGILEFEDGEVCRNDESLESQRKELCLELQGYDPDEPDEDDDMDIPCDTAKEEEK